MSTSCLSFSNNRSTLVCALRPGLQDRGRASNTLRILQSLMQILHGTRGQWSTLFAAHILYCENASEGKSMKKIVMAFSVFLLCINLHAACLLRGVQFLETGSETTDMAVADFNRDGVPDVAIAGAEAGVVRVFLNQGDGSFALSSEKRLKNAPALVKAADFNGDTVPDLAVASSGAVAILLNDGAGKFTIALQRVNIHAVAIAAGDFNSDSIADLAVLTRNGNAGTVSVYLNTSGSFQKATTLAVKSPVDLLSAKLGTGAAIDLVVSSDLGSITVFRGSRTGTFQATPAVRAVPGAGRLAAGLIDDDNLTDLVVAGSGGSVAVLLGQNETEFKRIQLSTDSAIQGLALADFNGDHKTDLFLVNRNSLGSLYAGNAHGAFSFARGFALGYFSGPLAAADFNGDGKTDLLAAEPGSTGVFPGDGNGGFSVGVRTVAKQGGNTIAGDFDGDGIADLLVSGSNGSTFYRGKGNGSFEPPVPTELPQLGYTTVFDIDQDGKDDLVGFDTFILKAWLSEGPAQFKETAHVPLSIDPPVQSLDMNGDGFLDLAVMMPNRLVIFLNQRNGQFDLANPVTLNGLARGVVADLNGDGFPDLAAIRDTEKKSVSVYLGAANLSFAKRVEIPLEGCPGGISSGDANGDGKADLVIGSKCGGQATLLIGDGTGGFSSIAGVPSGSGVFDPFFLDLNGDGKSEIVAIAHDSGKISVTAAPAFHNYQLIGPFYWNHIAVADFDRDGHPDLATSSFNATAVFLNCQ